MLGPLPEAAGDLSTSAAHRYEELARHPGAHEVAEAYFTECRDASRQLTFGGLSALLKETASASNEDRGRLQPRQAISSSFGACRGAHRRARSSCMTRLWSAAGLASRRAASTSRPLIVVRRGASPIVSR